MASKSKQLISCMSKAKGNAKKIAACKSSFAKKLKAGDQIKQREFIERINTESAGDDYQRTA
jgi:ABC-type sulfate transport system substrate-binding protein